MIRIKKIKSFWFYKEYTRVSMTGDRHNDLETIGEILVRENDCMSSGNGDEKEWIDLRNN